MSIINLEINFFMTREIYVSRELTHPLHYQSLHSLPHYYTYSYISHQHTVSPSFMSLPTVPQYSQISHCFTFYFFSVLTRYPFIISYSSIPSFKSLTAPLHLPLSSPYKVIKCIQRMRTQWTQHFQRPRIYHNYSYYPYS